MDTGSYIIGSMKTRKVIRRIKKLLSAHGTYESVGVVLRCSARYVRNMENGMEPGERLYRDVCIEYEKVK